jgi:hypothetical protein
MIARPGDHAGSIIGVWESEGLRSCWTGKECETVLALQATEPPR